MLRRAFLLGSAGVVTAAATAYANRNSLFRWQITRFQNEAMEISDALGSTSDLCVLTPEQAEGPYFLKAPVRGDIREDRAGIEYDLALQVVGASGCTPVENALVEIWHCDSAGRYSSYPEDLARKPLETMRLIGSRDLNAHVEPTNQKSYLRGAQITDENGFVSFKTIFPGWYDPRIPHIHVKVFLAGESQLTTQLYFDEAVSKDVFCNSCRLCALRYLSVYVQERPCHSQLSGRKHFEDPAGKSWEWYEILR